MIERMLYFSKILAEEVWKLDEVFWDTSYRDLLRGTELLVGNGISITLADAWEEPGTDELRYAIHNEDERCFEDYVDEDEIEGLSGILFCNDYLYELIYDFGMLGETFCDRNRQQEKNETIQEFLRTVYKIASAFYFDLEFCEGRIYLRSECPYEILVCKTMEEVEVVAGLRRGDSILGLQESSGMEREEFQAFYERLKQQTSIRNGADE